MADLVFLGGTCGNNNWRESFIEELCKRGAQKESLFNPVVPDWTPECQAAEDKAKKEADYMVFYLANPKQPGNPVSAYSMIEATMALYDDPERTVVIFDTAGMEGHALKAMQKTEKDLRARFPDSYILGSRADAILWLAERLA